MARIKIDDLPVTEALAPEQEALVEGAGLKPFRPGVEALEGREVPAGITLANGVLTIQGSDFGNMARVTIVEGDRARGEGDQVMAVLDFRTQRFDATQVRSIVFRGEGGNDSFTNHTAIPST